jgi:hypothetical protein
MVQTYLPADFVLRCTSPAKGLSGYGLQRFLSCCQRPHLSVTRMIR